MYGFSEPFSGLKLSYSEDYFDRPLAVQSHRDIQMRIIPHAGVSDGQPTEKVGPVGLRKGRCEPS